MPRAAVPTLTDDDTARLRKRVTAPDTRQSTMAYPLVPILLDGGPLDGITVLHPAKNADGGAWFCITLHDGMADIFYEPEIHGVWRYKLIQWVKGAADYAAMRERGFEPPPSEI